MKSDSAWAVKTWLESMNEILLTSVCERSAWLNIRGIAGMPTLLVRKRRALEQELDTTLAETCDNIESVERWDSRESVTSTQSDNLFDRSRTTICNRSGSLQVSYYYL